MKSYEYSYSDGEVDEAQGYPSDDEVPSEPVRECKRLSRLNTTGTLGRAALKVQSYKCVPAVRFFKKSIQSLFSVCHWINDATKCPIMSNELVLVYWHTLIVHYGTQARF